MLGNHLENFQELWVPENGQKQAKIAQISPNWVKFHSGNNCNPQIGV